MPLASLAFAIGCGPADPSGGDSAEHDHDHRPYHHPESFPASISAVRVRLLPASTGHERSQVELKEILAWMPELAADSEIKEADWTPLAAGAAELEALLPRLTAGDQAALTEANQTLDELNAAVSELGRDAFESVPHESHRHQHGDGHVY
ncbi:MAG: hypothetical protein AAF907_10885 [Planctomycetota bacterium]